MKLLHITFHFEYGEFIERLLDQHGVEQFVRYPMMDGKDAEGKHYGTQVHPGNVTIVQARVRAEAVEGLLAALRTFREQKPAHRHLEALVLPIERRL